MKKILFLLAMLPMMCYGQEPYKVYCQIVGSETLTGDVKIRIDFGQDKSDNSKIVDKEGNDIKFNSMIDAVNYVAKKGWAFEQTYAYREGNSSVYHYMFSKMVTDDSQIRGDIRIKEDFKKKK